MPRTQTKGVDSCCQHTTFCFVFNFPHLLGSALFVGKKKKKTNNKRGIIFIGNRRYCCRAQRIVCDLLLTQLLTKFQQQQQPDLQPLVVQHLVVLRRCSTTTRNGRCGDVYASPKESVHQPTVWRSCCQRCRLSVRPTRSSRRHCPKRTLLLENRSCSKSAAISVDGMRQNCSCSLAGGANPTLAINFKKV